MAPKLASSLHSSLTPIICFLQNNHMQSFLVCFGCICGMHRFLAQGLNRGHSMTTMDPQTAEPPANSDPLEKKKCKRDHSKTYISCYTPDNQQDCPTPHLKNPLQSLQQAKCVFSPNLPSLILSKWDLFPLYLQGFFLLLFHCITSLVATPTHSI